MLASPNKTKFKFNTDGKAIADVAFVEMSDGSMVRIPKLETAYTKPNSTYWVTDGYGNNKRYKTFASAQKAYKAAIGDLIIAGFVPHMHYPHK